MKQRIMRVDRGMRVKRERKEGSEGRFREGKESKGRRNMSDGKEERIKEYMNKGIRQKDGWRREEER